MSASFAAIAASVLCSRNVTGTRLIQKNKGPGGPGLLPSLPVAYFSEELIEPNCVERVPRLLTTVMIASAMPAAIRPYSMAWRRIILRETRNQVLHN